MVDLFTLISFDVDDSLKAAARSGLCTLPSELHQNGTYAEPATIALVGDRLGEPSAQQWYAQVRTTYCAAFPTLPDRSRYLRIQLNLERIDADLALRVPHLDDDTRYVIDSTPAVCCLGGRHVRPSAMTTAASGYGGMEALGARGCSTASRSMP